MFKKTKQKQHTEDTESVLHSGGVHWEGSVANEANPSSL